MEKKIIIAFILLGLGFMGGHFIWPQTKVETVTKTTNEVVLTDVRNAMADCVFIQGGTFVADYDLDNKNNWVDFISTSTTKSLIGGIHAYCSLPASQKSIDMTN